MKMFKTLNALRGSAHRIPSTIKFNKRLDKLLKIRNGVAHEAGTILGHLWSGIKEHRFLHLELDDLERDVMTLIGAILETADKEE